MLCALVAGTLAIARLSPRPLVTVLVVTLFSVGFAAPKLLPTWELLRAHPQTMQGVEKGSLDVLYAALFSRHQDLYRHTVGPWGFHEYGAYIGPIAAVLALAGVASSPRRGAGRAGGRGGRPPPPP